jgi:hypothetical protein
MWDVMSHEDAVKVLLMTLLNTTHVLYGTNWAQVLSLLHNAHCTMPIAVRNHSVALLLVL